VGLVGANGIRPMEVRLKRILFIILLSFSLFAEEGEMQISAGVGGFFPLRHTTTSGEISSFPGLTVPLQVLIGIHDNFDVGLMGEWGYLSDITQEDVLFGSLRGDEYADYMHGSVMALFRWNFLPGYSISPHLTCGAGLFIERYYNRELYIGESIFPHYDSENRIIPLFNGFVGVDVVFRLPWWHLFIKGEVLFNANKNTLFLTANVYFGFSWMISSFYFL